jgi:hypothetical protein
MARPLWDHQRKPSRVIDPASIAQVSLLGIDKTARKKAGPLRALL